DISTELLTLRIAGDTAAFHFRVTTRHAGGASVIEPIDVMTFDDAGLITSMRAVWGPAAVRHEPKERVRCPSIPPPRRPCRWTATGSATCSATSAPVSR